MAKKVKSVGFNSNNPEEAAMLKAIRRRNFSGYVKKLIAADLRARETAQAVTPTPTAESSQYESPEVPQQYSNESPEIPAYYEQPRKKPAHYTQATPSHYPHHPQQPPQQYYPPTQDPRNRPMINPQPRRY